MLSLVGSTSLDVDVVSSLLREADVVLPLVEADPSLDSLEDEFTFTSTVGMFTLFFVPPKYLEG